MCSSWAFCSLLYLVLHVYLFGIELPNWMIHGLDFLATRGRARSKVTPEGITLALCLMTMQTWRRMYECFYVNAPSKVMVLCLVRLWFFVFDDQLSFQARMNLLHYLCGYIHYACVGLGIVSHAPGLIRPHSLHLPGHDEARTIKWVHIELSPLNLSLVQLAAAAVFVWAWRHQFIAHKIFARTKRQAASAGGYGVPQGDWFNYISCPHYAAECLLYLR